MEALFKSLTYRIKIKDQEYSLEAPHRKSPWGRPNILKFDKLFHLREITFYPF